MMEEIINTITKSISRYEFINNLIPGVLLCYLLQYVGYDFLTDKLVTNLVIGYVVGVINGRVSSLVVEPFCRKVNIIQWRDYRLYNEAKKQRPFISTLQETANMYRSMASIFLIVLLFVAFKWMSRCWVWLNDNAFLILLIILLILFLFSYRKQVNDYVVKNIDETTNTES